MRVLRRIVVIAVLGALLLWLLVPDSGPSIEQDSVLVVDLAGSYLEAVEPPLVARLMGERYRSFASLLSELRKAGRDERLAGVVLRIRDLEVGWAQAQEIRQEVRDLAERGVPTLAYLEVASFGANLEYYVATAAGEIHAHPATRAPLVGLAAEYLFLGGLWEQIGVELEVERIGEYKTAADTFAAREMSEAHREMANALLDSIDAQFVAGIAEGRDVPEDYVRVSIDAAPLTPEELLKLGLIDAVSFYDEAVEHLGEGPVVRANEYARVSPASLGIEPVAKFALVYGSGAVVAGRGSSSPTGNPVLAADTVGDALTEAAEDGDIDAIIFRIDSPGGSALASDAVWRATQLARESGKPFVASLSNVAASGGYYAAAGADDIVASGGSITGSIGVFAIRPVLGGLFEKLGIGVASLTRGRSADLQLSTRRLSPASRARLRAEVESIYDLFVARVAEGRDLAADRVDEIGRGRVWTGAQALEVGLVDTIGGIREAVRLAKVAVGIDPEADVALMPFPRPKPLVQQVDEALRRVALLGRPALPRLVRQLEDWLAAAPEGGPGLVPPFLVEIR